VTKTLSVAQNTIVSYRWFGYDNAGNVNVTPIWNLSTVPTFEVSSFTCSPITGGHTCTIVYNNNLGENAVVVFLFADSRGKVVSVPAPIVGTNSGTASVVLYCSSVTAGTYSVKWRAYRQSDTLLLNSVAWSPSSQSIIC
jgi:hypothetical protein